MRDVGPELTQENFNRLREFLGWMIDGLDKVEELSFFGEELGETLESMPEPPPPLSPTIALQELDRRLKDADSETLRNLAGAIRDEMGHVPVCEWLADLLETYRDDPEHAEGTFFLRSDLPAEPYLLFSEERDGLVTGVGMATNTLMNKHVDLARELGRKTAVYRKVQTVETNA